MNSLAIVVTRGSSNSLASVCTMAMAAAVSEISVRIFFRDEAVLKLSKKHVKGVKLSEAFRGMESEVTKSLEKAGLADLQALLKEVKAQGDVKLYACTSSMAIAGITPADLIPEIDEPRGLTSFLLEEMSAPDTAILTF